MSRIERFNSVLAEYSGFSYALMRSGLGFLWIVTGAAQIINPQTWVNFVSPLITTSMPVPAETFLLIHGAILIAEGLLLVLDRFTSIVASIIALGSTSIAINLLVAGFNPPEMLYTVSAILIAAVVALEAAER